LPVTGLLFPEVSRLTSKVRAGVFTAEKGSGELGVDSVRANQPAYRSLAPFEDFCERPSMSLSLTLAGRPSAVAFGVICFHTVRPAQRQKLISVTSQVFDN